MCLSLSLYKEYLYIPISIHLVSLQLVDVFMYVCYCIKELLFSPLFFICDSKPPSFKLFD